MATSSVTLRQRFTPSFRLDWYACFIIAATIVVQLLAVDLAMVLTSLPSNPAPEQTTSATSGGTMVGVVIVETVVLVLLWRLSRYLPEWLRAYAKKALGVAALVGVYWLVYQVLGVPGVVVGSVGIALAWAAAKYDYYWLFHNTVALLLGTLAAVSLGVSFSPRVILVFMALITVWDMVAVWATDWMDGMLELATGLNLPVYLVIPTATRIDLDKVADWIADKEDKVRPGGVGGAIGLGDLGIPAALAVSAAVALPGGAQSPAVVGTLIGACVATVVLRGAMGDGTTLPALPWLATGSVAGFVLGVGVAGISLVSVLGGGV